MTISQIATILLMLVGLLGLNGIYNLLVEIKYEAKEQTEALNRLSETFLQLYKVVNTSLENAEADDGQS